MLTLNEKAKIKDVLADGLGINRNINLAYFLNSIDSTNKKTAELSSKIDQILYNQKCLDQKLNEIIRHLNRLG